MRNNYCHVFGALRAKLPRATFEIDPVHWGDFDFYHNHGPFQVRISVWGWPAKLLYRLMFRRWRKRGCSPAPNGEVTACAFNYAAECATALRLRGGHSDCRDFTTMIAALRRRKLLPEGSAVGSPTVDAVIRAWTENCDPSHEPTRAELVRLGLLWPR